MMPLHSSIFCTTRQIDRLSHISCHMRLEYIADLIFAHISLLFSCFMKITFKGVTRNLPENCIYFIRQFLYQNHLFFFNSCLSEYFFDYKSFKKRACHLRQKVAPISEVQSVLLLGYCVYINRMSHFMGQCTYIIQLVCSI